MKEYNRMMAAHCKAMADAYVYSMRAALANPMLDEQTRDGQVAHYRQLIDDYKRIAENYEYMAADRRDA